MRKLLSTQQCAALKKDVMTEENTMLRMIVIRFIHFTQHNDIVDVSVNVIDVDQTPTMKTLCLRRQKAIKFIDTKYIHRQ